MDFNILIPSIAKTLGMPTDTKEQVGELSHKLMNYLAEHRMVSDGLDEAFENAKIEALKLGVKTANLNAAEKALIELMGGESLSGIVKEKNKAVIASHGIKRDYINKCMIYPDAEELKG